MSFRNIPKNLYPKFKLHSRISNSVRDIINEVQTNPIKINNIGSTSKIQKSSFNNKSSICEYNNLNLNYLSDINYFDKLTNEKIDNNLPFHDKKEIFLKAADLIENKYYDMMLAYTILGQNKTIYEAELDAICELVDFLRFNVYYCEKILEKQPLSLESVTNISEYNSLNGFVASITPFNFTAIGGNLASSPILFNNKVLWKPSDSAILSNYLFYEIMLEAGLPEGYLNFVPMDNKVFLETVTKNANLGGILFTGSSTVLDTIYKKVGTNIERYKSYPRIIGESGGKNFHFVDNSYLENNLYNLEDRQIVNKNNNLKYIVSKTIESAFNYSGQKCSACSIIYLPEELVANFMDEMNIQLPKFIKNHENYGVINDVSYKRIMNKIKDYNFDKDVECLHFGEANNDERYYIEPQIYLCRNPNRELFTEEFFGPILAIYPYKDIKDAENHCLNINNYALTGSIFTNNIDKIGYYNKLFRNKTGNFYINDKSTGSVVGQQPFGGSGKSGTNDKAGDINLLYRLFNQRNVKISSDFSL